MITIEKPTQITILCTFKNKEESDFFDFDVCKDGDVIASDILYSKLSLEMDVLSVNYFIGKNLIKSYSRVVQLN